MAKNFYLTTTLPYVNADPHIGFALEMVQADIIARYRKLRGDDVFFNTGTDEHGQKIFQKAKEEGRDVQEYVDHFAGEFKKLRESLNLSYNAFVRTTDAHHVAAAQELWRRCEKDIYKKKYKGLYCVGDEAFIKESDLVNGKCPNHPTMDPVEIEEENYFFRLSAYQEKLLEYLSREGVIVPEWRRQEAIKFVQNGLEDFSISRIKEKMSWGVPVPGDDSQVMYVWFDALTNYISTLGWPEDAEGNFKKYWDGGETLQLAGKDQVRFQSIMWQAMLMSADIKTTDKVLYHGFITSGGQKMSKSLGNVIDPLTVAAEYGTDALRYFLARHIHPFEDSDFTMERFKDAYNADLANGLGNLVARIMKMATENLSGPVTVSEDSINLHKSLEGALNAFDFSSATNILWEEIGKINLRIQDTKPFVLVKVSEHKERAVREIESLVQRLLVVATSLGSFMPKTSKQILDAIKENKKPENLFPRKE